MRPVNLVRIHAIEAASRANGPGARLVIWFAGCNLACPGCYNPDSHDPARGQRASLDELRRMIEDAPVGGISLSGGEPLQQPEAAWQLATAARSSGKTVLLFSGYTLEEIRAQPLGPTVLEHVDVLIDGRYVASQRRAHGLRGSNNQRIHLLTSAYTLAEVEATADAEVRIDREGNVVLSGVNPLKAKDLTRR